MKYKLVIFDFDGTLADSYPFFLGVQNELAKKYNFRQLTEEELKAIDGDPLEIVKRAGMPLWKLPFTMVSARRMLSERIDQIPLFEGVLKTMEALSKKGAMLSMITSNSYANVAKKLGADTVSLFRNPQFKTSLFGKGARLKKLISKTRIDPAKVIYIGDEVRDVKSAKSQHVPFGAVSWGYTSLDTLRKYSPEEVFHSMEEIVEIVSQE